MLCKGGLIILIVNLRRKPRKKINPTGKLHVAFIDDGIDPKICPSIKQALYVDPETEKVLPEPVSALFRLTHGTTCCQVFQHYCKEEKNIEITSLNIMAGEEKGNIYHLKAALHWCGQHGVDLINLSIGSVAKEDKGMMFRMTKKAYKKGCLMVAANKNAPLRTYPSTFDHIIGVECDHSGDLKTSHYKYIPDHPLGLDYQANIDPSIVHPKNHYQSNSTSTPFITALVANYMTELLLKGVKNKGLNEIKNALNVASDLE